MTGCSTVDLRPTRWPLTYRPFELPRSFEDPLIVFKGDLRVVAAYIVVFNTDFAVLKPPDSEMTGGNGDSGYPRTIPESHL